jgi:hypothetical protein
MSTAPGGATGVYEIPSPSNELSSAPAVVKRAIAKSQSKPHAESVPATTIFPSAWRAPAKAAPRNVPFRFPSPSKPVSRPPSVL